MKRFFSFILVFLMLISVFSISITAYALDINDDLSETGFLLPNEKVYGDYVYEVLENGTAQLNSYTGSDINLVLPSKIDGYTVTAIDEYIFSEYSEFETLTIPASIININYGDFSENSSVFGDCRKLKSISVDKNNTAFCSVDGVLFDKSMEIIIRYPQMKEGNAYTIPNGVKYIFNYALSQNQYLQSVTIPDGVLEIGASAFWMSTNISSIPVPDSVTYIMFNAFSHTAIKEINLGNSLQLLGEYAFDNCWELEYIHIPAGIIRLESNVFNGCSALKSITVDENNPIFYAESGVLLTKDKSELVLYAPNNSAEMYIVPDFVKKIRANAFVGSENLKEVIISDNVTYIGESAFSYCYGLNKVQLPNDIEKIPDCCFQNCSSLKNVIIPDNVKEIGAWAFDGCDSLKTIEIPNGVTTIGGCAFSDCKNLYKVSIPDSVTLIGSGAFMYCPELKSITIPATVTSIVSMSLGYNSDNEYMGDDFTIYGVKGSAAEEYANKYGVNFSTEKEPEPADPYLNKVLMGDVDGSMTVNVKDATMIQKFIADLVTLDSNSKLAANVVSADSLNVKDATAIQKWVAGITIGVVINEYVDISDITPPEIPLEPTEPTEPTEMPTTAPKDDLSYTETFDALVKFVSENGVDGSLLFFEPITIDDNEYNVSLMYYEENSEFEFSVSLLYHELFIIGDLSINRDNQDYFDYSYLYTEDDSETVGAIMYYDYDKALISDDCKLVNYDYYYNDTDIPDYEMETMSNELFNALIDTFNGYLGEYIENFSLSDLGFISL